MKAYRVLAALILGAGCSTPSVADDAGGPTDAASGPQPIGATCDPAIAVPCLPTGDPCLGVRCDPTTLLCASYVPDAAASCSGGQSPCTTDADCDVGLACGFPIGAGCSGVQGFCINPPLLCENDASACGGAGTVCGCGGFPVAILVPGYAAAPTPAGSPGGACSGDAGGSAEDGSSAAASDAASTP
jgi:hypothetical protein